MNQLRVCLAVGLIVTGLAVIPVSMIFGDQKLTDTIRQAKATVCMNTFTLCTNQCSARASSAPGSYPICMQECAQQYSRCMSAISRGAPGSRPAGITSHPSVAPPKPTPRKIAPERVDGVNTIKASPTASPRQSLSTDGRNQPATPRGTFGTRRSLASPTATPAKK